MRSFIRVKHRIRLEFEGKLFRICVYMSRVVFFFEEYLIYCIAFLESDDNKTR